MAIRLINFSNEQNIQIVDVHTTNMDHNLGYYHSKSGFLLDNFVLHGMYNSILGITAYNLWKYEEENARLILTHSINDIDIFVNYPLSDGFIRRIEKVFYYKNHYIVTAKVTVRDVPTSPASIAYFYSLALMIVDLDGEILRKVTILEYDSDHSIEIMFFENKFLFRVDESVFIFEQPLEAIFDPNRNYRNMMKYEGITEAAEREVILFSKCEMKKVELFYILDGSMRLRIKKLNFWQ